MRLTKMLTRLMIGVFLASLLAAQTTDSSPRTGGSAITVVTASSCPVTVTTPGFYRNDSTGACTFTLPVITAAMVSSGFNYCFRNAVTRTGVITLKAPASTFIDLLGTNGAAAGTMVSGGALGDYACVVAVALTQYSAYAGTGSWTNS